MTFTLSPTRNRTCTTTTRANVPSIFTFLTVWKERRALANLDESRLQDLGISAADAAKEAARPVWDLPTRHRC